MGLCNDGEFYINQMAHQNLENERNNFNEISYVEVTTDKTILKK